MIRFILITCFLSNAVDNIGRIYGNHCWLLKVRWRCPLVYGILKPTQMLLRVCLHSKCNNLPFYRTY